MVLVELSELGVGRVERPAVGRGPRYGVRLAVHRRVLPFGNAVHSFLTRSAYRRVCSTHTSSLEMHSVMSLLVVEPTEVARQGLKCYLGILAGPTGDLHMTLR